MNDEMMTMNPVEYSRQGQRHIKRRAIDEEINEFFSKQLPAIIRRIETLEKAQQIDENIDKISWALPRNALISPIDLLSIPTTNRMRELPPEFDAKMDGNGFGDK